ncbi:MAG: PH domain-containing protein [Actinomycetota bacterium]|nr:PH domain-containing protein [Actinomycetota bacterium]
MKEATVRAESGDAPPTAAPDRRRFGPERIALLPVTIFGLGGLPVAGSHPLLSLLLLVPLGCGAWVLRARVVAAPVGVEVCNGLRAHRLAWADVEGFTVPKRGPVRLLRTGGRPLALTALPRRELPQLVAVAERAASSARSAAT